MFVGEVGLLVVDWWCGDGGGVFVVKVGVEVVDWWCVAALLHICKLNSQSLLEELLNTEVRILSDFILCF